jgi:hypothetical protein
VDASTIPSDHEDLVAGGAAAFAALEWANAAIGRVTTSGERASDEYLQWGAEAAASFRSSLERLRREARAGTLRLANPSPARVR